MDDEHVARVQLEEAHHGPHAQAGFIHEGGGLHQQDAGTGRQLALALPVRLEHGAPPGSQAVHHHETRVVAGIFISPARIAQAHDHFNGCVHDGREEKK